MPTIYVLNRNMKIIRIFYLKIFIFLVLKFSVYLNRHVFVMCILGRRPIFHVNLLYRKRPKDLDQNAQMHKHAYANLTFDGQMFLGHHFLLH